MKNKVAVIGAGNVGASAALFIAERALADVVLIDRPEMDGMPQGKALDMQQAAPLWHKGGRIDGATDLAAVKGCDVVVMTAGFPRKPGMSRSDLLKANADIIRPAAEAVKQHAPNAIVVVVTNPLDVMTWLFWKTTGFPKHRVIGMAGILDSARFRAFLAMELGVSGADVQAMVLGGHGDSMVPVTQYTTVSGIPVSELIAPDRLAQIVQRTRDGGAEIVKLLKTGSAYYAPAMSAVEMVEAILTDQKRLLPCSVLLDGEYDQKGMFCGVPVVLGAKGVEKIVTLKLSATDQAALAKSAKDVADMIAELGA
ncbi:MAG: malate dehydrogenase [Candidatus Eisenbacteria bacterium]|uniref:Malate dehydrogenase n=1 Tax=Eiseniibacteriota bacterium TaxID=2212470 RepID=A0A849SN87_UNCEI|nr:malate dehydrogenase [Candidatus Eisenbacteria bacterium]